MYYPFVRKALFQLDPERAHEVTFQQLRRVSGTPLEMLVVRRCRPNRSPAWVSRLKIRWVWPLGWTRTASALMRSAPWVLAPLKLVP